MASLFGSDRRDQTLQRLIIKAAIGVSDSRVESANNSIAVKEWIRLSRKRVDHRVNRPPGAERNAVRDVSGCNRCVFRHVRRRADRLRLNTANAKAERKK
jgi:hypothetical protein